jgi:molybdenum cofactor guanylyltransferase
VNEDYAQFRCPVLNDRFEEAGPLASIERALAEVSSSRLLVVAVDMPNLTPAIRRQLIERGGDLWGVIARIDGRMEPLAAIYPKPAWNPAVSLFEDGIYAAQAFAGRCVQAGLADFCDFDASAAHYFADWNLPSDARSGAVAK